MNIAGAPSFIIIGAVKAATTWIAHQLRSRDDVFLPGPEPHYFSRDYARGPDWYARCFDGARPGQRIGEKSADYLAHESAAARIAKDLPGTRLIAQLRNPVDRAYSDYCMLYRRGQVSGNVAAELDPARTTQPRFLNDGLYAKHLARFFDHFPADHVEIILHDAIRIAPEQCAARVAAFLNLPPHPLADAEQRHNDSASAVLPLALRRLPAPIKGLAAPLRNNAAFRSIRGMFARPVDYPAFTPDVRARVQEYYRDDIARLQRMIGRDLTHWLNPVAEAA